MEANAPRVAGNVALLRLPERGAPAARQSFLREHNLAVVLRHLVESPRPPSRAELAKVTGLTRGTVSALVDLLMAGRMVVELEPESADRAGRPAVPLAPARDGIVGVGLEVQVDHVGALVVDLGGSVIDERIVVGNFRASDPERVVARLAELADRLVSDLLKRGARVAGVGVSMSGTVDDDRQIVRYAPNLDWYDVDVVALLRARSRELGEIPIQLANDGDLGALAEARTRARGRSRPRQEQSFLYVMCEIGVGGAVVVRGELEPVWSGEIGHVVVDRAGPPCACGARGCLEQYAGRDTLLTHSGLGLGSSLADLRRAVEAGDQTPIRVVADAAEALGSAIASTLNLVNLDAVVLGGGFAELADLLVPTIERAIRRRTLAARWRPIAVEVGVAGARASLSGAGILVADEVVANPSAWLATG